MEWIMLEMLSEESKVYFRGKGAAMRFFILYPPQSFCISHHSDTSRSNQWIKKTTVRRWEQSNFQSTSSIAGASGPHDTPDHAALTSEPESSTKVTDTYDPAIAHPSR